MKIKLYALALAWLPIVTHAQEFASSWGTLRLPVSSHVAALGGHNVTLITDDPAAGWANPALYANAPDMTLGVNFMTYTAGSSWMGAHFTKAFGERHTFAAGAQYMNYGTMDETDEAGTVIGSFNAKDIVVGAGYSYLLSDRWSGGANAKFVFSNLADYSAIALSIDVGLNYYDEDTDLSASAVLQNIGTQLKSYDNGLRTHLPFTLALGFTKGLEHLPVKISVTMTDVTRWKSSYYAITDDSSDEVSFSKKLLNHFVIGLDILPTDYLYLSLGYNFRRANELKASGSSHWAGISAGGGVNIKRFQFGISYARYHQAGNSLMFTAAYKLPSIKKKTKVDNEENNSSD